MQKFENIRQMFARRVEADRGKPAYFERAGDGWRAVTWGELARLVDSLALAFLESGLEKGDAVAILSANRLIWPVADLAAISAGGISVGLYPTSSPEQCAYILNHCGAKFAVADTPAQLAKILAVRERLPGLAHVIAGSVAPEQEKSGAVLWDEFLRRGESAAPERRAQCIRAAESAGAEETAIIVYTSGTTGDPKGACLSHRYVTASAESLGHLLEETRKSLPPETVERFRDETVVTLSFLPYCHVAERISGMYSRIHSGGAAYLVDEPERLYRCMLEVNPHMFGGVPRFFEKIYAKVMNEVENGQGYDKAGFAKAIETNRAVERFRLRNESIPESLAADREAAEKVAARVRANFGNRILTCSSGAAPIPKEVLDMFRYAGNLPILEAYGLTEFICCAFNTPRAHKANSVGRPMHGCEIRIAEDGEILLRGPQVFSGYYKDEQATREVLDPDGTLRTGDIGRLDEDGFLFITGRKKEFIKTSTGKKIAPLYIENICKRNHLIGNVMVYGDNRKYLVAILTLNPPELLGYARAHNLGCERYEELTRHPAVRAVVDKAIEEVNRQVSSTEQIKKYAILETDFSVESGEITPTGKIKRKVVAEKCRATVESMYA